MDTKRIIQRNLPLTQIYVLISTNYIPLIDGIGTCCDNCGKLIANMATVKGLEDTKSYTIGLDCLETFLINNNRLKAESVEHFKTCKKAMPKVIKIRSEVKDFLQRNSFIDSVKIENLFDSWIIVNYFQHDIQRWNEGYKYKTMDLQLLIESLQTINKNVKFTLTNI